MIPEGRLEAILADAIVRKHLEALEEHAFGISDVLEDAIIRDATGFVTYSLFLGEPCAVPCAGRLEFRADAPPEPGEDPRFDEYVREWYAENPEPATRLELLQGREARRRDRTTFIICT